MLSEEVRLILLSCDSAHDFERGRTQTRDRHRVPAQGVEDAPGHDPIPEYAPLGARKQHAAPWVLSRSVSMFMSMLQLVVDVF